jgi:dTDP-4-dehydrorhamnose 3,5-epimerase
MHIQTSPSEEAKIVRCTRGAMFDVALDLRPDSATYCHWVGAELTPVNGKALLIPPGCAHGFQSLTDDTEVHYLMHGKYNPDAATGVRHDDPAFGIEWPVAITSVSAKDRSWPDFDAAAGLAPDTTT